MNAEWDRSSAVEHYAYNIEGDGSNPSGPTQLLSE